MSELDNIVSVSITTNDLVADRINFGLPLIAGYFPTSIFPERVREYSTTAEMVADGFSATHPMVRAASKLTSQDPKVRSFKIGRRAVSAQQTINLTPTSTTEGDIVSVTVVSPDGTETVVSRTNGAGEAAPDITLAFAPLLTAVVGMTATNAIGSIDCVGDASGDLFDYKALRNLAVIDNTVNAGLTADLTAIESEDASWYALGLDSNSKAEIALATAWIESRKKIGLFNSADAEILASTAGNAALVMQAAAYNRSAILWSGSVLSYAAIAWLGRQLPEDPGASTWMFQRLSGITRDSLTTANIAALKAQRCNYYIAVAGIGTTGDGVMASGRFIDVQRTSDYFIDQIQVSVFELFSNAKKIPYTDGGVSLVKAEIKGILREGRGSATSPGPLDPGVEPLVTAPLVASVSTANRASRHLPDIHFSARLSGGVHSITIVGVLSV